MIVVDEFNKKAWCIPLKKKKSDIAIAIKEWIVVHENEAGKRIKKMRSNHGGEYIDAGFETWMSTAHSSRCSKMGNIFLLQMGEWHHPCLTWWKIAATMRTTVRVRGGMMTNGDKITMLWRNNMSSCQLQPHLDRATRRRGVCHPYVLSRNISLILWRKR